MPVVEINSDITTNQVWTANNAYHITAENVNVRALLVIEPGTTVAMSYLSGLIVNNGGTLIARGLPGKPIIFTPDYLYFQYPYCVGYYWQALIFIGPQYYCPLYVESTASTATTIQHCLVEGALGGIVTNNIRLTNPIENNYVCGNGYGIYEIGPHLTDIVNNLCFSNDEAGIEVYLASDPNDMPDQNNVLKIEHNTCDFFQYAGITIHGVTDPNRSPFVNLTNNIISNISWYGLNLVDGYINAAVSNTGYYGNFQNKNWAFDEENPVTAALYPFEPEITINSVFAGGPLAHHYLAANSEFVNAGEKWAEHTPFVGKGELAVGIEVLEGGRA